MLKRSLFLVLIVALAHTGISQSFHHYRIHREFVGTIGGGTFHYFGELPASVGYNVDLGLEYRVDGRISGRFHFMYQRFSGKDSDTTRNLSFRSSNLELGLTGTVSLFDEGKAYFGKRTVNPYLIAGFAMARIKPKADIPDEYAGNPLPDAGKYTSLRELMTEGNEYKRWQPVIPIGIGGEFAINYFFSIQVEAIWRLTFTDYLDDVSTVYVDQSTFGNPIAAALADRRPEVGLTPADAGTPRGMAGNDSYMSINIKLAYNIPATILSVKQGPLAGLRNKMRK
jgi:hypothetical protein